MSRKLTVLGALLLALALVGGQFGQADAAEPGKPTITTTGERPVGVGTNAWGNVPNGAGLPVWIEVQINGQWSTSQRGTVASNGQYALPLTYGSSTPGAYSFRVGVRGSSGKVTYSTAVQFVRYATPTANSAGTKPVGAQTHIWGSVAGGAGLPVWTEALVGGKWSTSQRGTVGSNGQYALPLTYNSTKAGGTTFRVGVRNTSGRVAYSGAVTLTRTGWISAQSAGVQPVGARTNVWGTAHGMSAGTPIWVEVWTGSTWSMSQRSTVRAGGGYTLPLTYGANTAGGYVFHVVARDSAGLVRYSPQFTLTRTSSTASRLDSRCLSGRVMCASKKDRKVYWVVNGTIRKTLDARFGCPSAPSDNGSFRVYWKSYNHTSTLYHTWMPRAMFYNGGEAVHYSQDFAARGYSGCSHGCVNIRDWNGINWLYNQVRNGDKVVVY